MRLSSSWAGLVLCGGKSSRMGRDKADLSWHGKTLLENTSSLLHQCGLNNIYSVGNARADIEDNRPYHGPAVATIEALQAGKLAGVEFVLVLPVDMPALTPATLHHLLRYAQANRFGCFFYNFMLPVVLKVSRQFIASCHAHENETSQLSMRTLIRLNQAVALDVGENVIPSLVNVNYPAQWQSFLQSQVRGAISF